MDDEDPAELVTRLFALLTAQLEDGVTLAVEGQGRHILIAQHERAQALEARVRDAHTIAEALILVTRPPDVVADASARR